MVVLAEIVEDGGARTVAAGFLIERLFQWGRIGLVQRGIPIVALAQVEHLEGGRVTMAGS